MAKAIKMVALGTVRRGELIEPASVEADATTGRTRIIPARTERKTYAPGDEFTVASQEEADALLASGAARAASAKEPEDAEELPVAENTAPRGPFSGETEAPDSNAVATETKPSDPNPDDAPVTGQPVNEVRRSRAR